MLALCLMLSMTHYAQIYAGIVGGSLPQLQGLGPEPNQRF